MYFRELPCTFVRWTGCHAETGGGVAAGREMWQGWAGSEGTGACDWVPGWLRAWPACLRWGFTEVSLGCCGDSGCSGRGFSAAPVCAGGGCNTQTRQVWFCLNHF